MLVEVCYAQSKEEMLGALTKFSRDREATADAVQDAFCKALQNRMQLEQMPEGAMKAWLYAAARNALIDGKRKASRLTFQEADDMGSYIDDDPVDRITVRQLLDRLPVHLREISILRYYAGLNSTEIGLMLHLPSATVRTRLRQALAIMKRINS